MSVAPTEIQAYMPWAKAQAMARLSQPVSATPPQPHVTFIMGNEAGDLDSAASAIALSYILNHDQSYFVHTYRVPGGVYVPLIQTPRNALYQRRENLAVYEAVGIALEDLLCIDELGPLSTRRLGSAANVSLGLVDHAKLSEVWGDQHVVDVIVDHHEDEGAHMDAPLRIIYAPTVHPVGSAASIVAMLAAQAQAETAQALPSGVADLLLSAIVLDTRNVRTITPLTHSYVCSPTAKARRWTCEHMLRFFLRRRFTRRTPVWKQWKPCIHHRA